MCMCVCMFVLMGISVSIIYLVRMRSSSFAYLICRGKISRGWKSARERVREREREREFRVRVREKKHRVGEKMRRAGPSRDDVNTTRRIRLGPSCDVGIRYRDSRLLREVSKRRQI
jgi:hypothetical protein